MNILNVKFFDGVVFMVRIKWNEYMYSDIVNRNCCHVYICN